MEAQEAREQKIVPVCECLNVGLLRHASEMTTVLTSKPRHGDND